MDWHHRTSPRPSYATYGDSPPSAYEKHHQPQPPPSDMRSSYGYTPPPPMMSSRSGGLPPPPHESSYWYEGKAVGINQLRRPQPPPAPSPHPPHGSSGWNHHGMHPDYDSSYERGMPPPLHHQRQHGYVYPYLPDMKQPLPVSDNRGRGGPRLPPSTMNMNTTTAHPAMTPPRPLQPRRGGESESAGRSGYLHHPTSPHFQKASENTSEQLSRPTRPVQHSPPAQVKDKKNAKKSGDPLSLLAKVSSAMAHDGNKKGGKAGNKEAPDQSTQATDEHSTQTPTSPPRQAAAQRSQSQIITPTSISKPPVSRQITPASTVAPEHPSYYSCRGPHPEQPYWPPSESDYPRHAHDPIHTPRGPLQAAGPPSPSSYRSGGSRGFPHRHPPPHPHHYPPPPPPSHYPPHPRDSGWGPNESPPALVERGPSFEGHEVDHHYPYYPPTTQPMSEPPPYDRLAVGPPSVPPNWKDYHHPPSASSRQPQHPHSSMATASSWTQTTTDAALKEGGNTGRHSPPSTPPQHMYPPPRWSYEFGRQHPGYGPSGQSRMNMGELSRPPPTGEASLSSTPPRPPSYPPESTRGSKHSSPYPQPHHPHPYHHPRHPPPLHPPPMAHVHRKDSSIKAVSSNTSTSSPNKNTSSNRMYAPYTYVQQPHMEEKTILRKKFSWKHYPELERFLIANRDEYLRHSSMNYTAEQKQYNNWLTDRLLEVAEEHHYAFDPEDFNFVAIRDRIRCYYKSYVQTARKRGLSLPTKESVGVSKSNKKSSTSPSNSNNNGGSLNETTNDLNYDSSEITTNA